MQTTSAAAKIESPLTFHHAPRGRLHVKQGGSRHLIGTALGHAGTRMRQPAYAHVPEAVMRRDLQAVRPRLGACTGPKLKRMDLAIRWAGQ